MVACFLEQLLLRELNTVLGKPWLKNKTKPTKTKPPQLLFTERSKQQTPKYQPRHLNMYKTSKKMFKIRREKKKIFWRWNSLNLMFIYQSMCLYLGRSPEDVFSLSRELDKQINEDDDTIHLINFLHS